MSKRYYSVEVTRTMHIQYYVVADDPHDARQMVCNPGDAEINDLITVMYWTDDDTEIVSVEELDDTPTDQ